MQNSIAAASIADKLDALSKWISHHVSPFAHDQTHWSPTGFGEGMELSSYMPLPSIMMIVVTVMILVVFGALYKRDRNGMVPKGFIAGFFEPIILFVRDEIAVKNMGKRDGHAWAPYFCTIFFFIVGCNLMGLIPGNATATGSFFVTGALAFMTFLCITLGTIIKYGPVKFFKGFMPEGVPGWVLILLTPLEMFGVLVKCFSLAIRLFANMLAGHIVLFSILGLVYVFGFIAVPAFFIGIAIYALEIFVALLQAYLFTFLSALFIGEMFHHAHGHDHDEEHAH
jgi:F-type H+-transporting ATPase subunit a